MNQKMLKFIENGKKMKNLSLIKNQKTFTSVKAWIYGGENRIEPVISCTASNFWEIGGASGYLIRFVNLLLWN